MKWTINIGIITSISRMNQPVNSVSITSITLSYKDQLFFKKKKIQRYAPSNYLLEIISETFLVDLGFRYEE